MVLRLITPYNIPTTLFCDLIGTALLIISKPFPVRSGILPLMYSPLEASSKKEIFPSKSISPALLTKVLSGFKIPILENKPIGLKDSNIIS